VRGAGHGVLVDADRRAEEAGDEVVARPARGDDRAARFDGGEGPEREDLAIEVVVEQRRAEEEWMNMELG